VARTLLAVCHYLPPVERSQSTRDTGPNSPHSSTSMVKGVLCGAAVLVAVATLAPSGAAANSTVIAYRLVQRTDRDTRLVTVTAAQGSRQLQQRRQGRRWRTTGGLVVRYRDAAMFVLEPARHSYTLLSLHAELAGIARDLRALRASSASERFPTATGRPPQPRVLVTALRAHRRIAGLDAEVLRVRNGSTLERLWYATGLPAPPPSLRGAVARFAAMTVAGGAQAAAQRSDQTLLRRERWQHGRWQPVLATVSARRTRVDEPMFAPPPDYHENPAIRKNGLRRSVPGQLQRQYFDLRGGVLDPLGPVANDPSVFAIYWGLPFFETPAFANAMNGFLGPFMTPFSPYSGYWRPMQQYDIRPRRFNGSVTVVNNPYRTVGTWNAAAITAEVIAAQGAGAPAVWSTLADDDPVIALFVASSTVNDGGWSGYHFWAPSLAGIIGWPLSLFFRPAIPCLIVRVPDGAGLGSPDAINAATVAFSHELLEAASDPYPFSGWVDTSKAPLWSEGELADICSTGSTDPWGSATWVNSTRLSTYWSNDDNACVPESRPTLELFGTPDGTRVRRDEVYLDGKASAPGEGDITGRIRWRDAASGFLNTGRVCACRHLTLGEHTIIASITSNDGLTVTASRIYDVYAEPPVVTIDAPQDGATLGVGQLLLRGSAKDPQDGALTGLSLRWRIDGTPVGSGEQLTAPVAAGDHLVALTATNSAGLSSTLSRLVHMVVGTPSVTIMQPANNSQHPEGSVNPITFTATASDPEDGPLSGASVKWFDSYAGATNVPLGQGLSLASTLPWLAQDWQNNRPTVHTITVTATDTAGHTAVDSIVIQVGFQIL
jgi:hypothetical protein